ncbi:hypothetical protein JCM12298_16140 [Desulfothermus naphthae]
MSFPKKIAEWKSSDNQTMDPKVARILHVDDYIWRRYKNEKGEFLDVYISYFSYVDRIKTYHSPLNCMPGSGWNIYKVESVPIYLSKNKKVNVSCLFLKKGSNVLKAIYWYQCRGRILDSEVKERIYRIADSVLKRRTDGAFIRIICLTNGVSKKELSRFCVNVIKILYKILPS